MTRPAPAPTWDDTNPDTPTLTEYAPPRWWQRHGRPVRRYVFTQQALIGIGARVVRDTPGIDAILDQIAADAD